MATSSSPDKKKKILEVALRLFTGLGYHETKLDEVAKQADIAKGTLYLYFKGKEDLFIQCMFDGSEKWERRALGIIDGPGSIRDRLKRLVELQIEVFTRNGPLIQQFLLIGNSLRPNSELAERIFHKMKERTEIFADFFRSGIESGEFSDSLTPMQMALIFQQVFDLNMKFQLFQVPPLTTDRCSDVLLNLFKS